MSAIPHHMFVIYDEKIVETKLDIDDRGVF